MRRRLDPMLWLMKRSDTAYQVWDTVVDEWVDEPVGRDQAVEEHGEDRVEWVDKHLCSCRARLGETVEIRNGRNIARGVGRLAYHFDSYEDVARYCRSQEEIFAELEEQEHG